jgi:hypothetical protein
VKDNPKANADPEEEVVHLVVKGEREKNNNLLLRPNSPPQSQLDRFVPLSDSYQIGVCSMSKIKKSIRNIQNTKVFPEDFDLKKHSPCWLTENFFPFL